LKEKSPHTLVKSSLVETATDEALTASALEQVFSPEIPGRTANNQLANSNLSSAQRIALFALAALRVCQEIKLTIEELEFRLGLWKNKR